VSKRFNAHKGIAEQERITAKMDVSSQMLSFVKDLETGSVSAAARLSGQTPSAVSKQVGHLEDHVGRRLLHRTRHGVSLTVDGEGFYEKCRAFADKFREVEDLVLSFSGTPRGTLRIASSVAFGKAQLIPVLPKFFDLHPEIGVSLELTDQQVDLEEEAFDVSLNFAEQMTNPSFITRKIMKNERVLCAAPAYLSRHGAPSNFGDLEHFNCLRTSNGVGRNAWQAQLDGVSYSVVATGNFEADSAHAVFLATLAGLGIARLSNYLVADKIHSGELVRLFPNYVQKHADVAVIYAEKRNLAYKTRVFVEFLVAQFQQRNSVSR
jgi:DNA-binding transcriptional LysR family regulator